MQSLKAVCQLTSLLQDGGLWAPPQARPPVPAFSSAPAGPQQSAVSGGAEDGDGGAAAPGSETSEGGAESAGGSGRAAGAEAGRSRGARALSIKLVGFSKGGTVLNQVSL